jgi:hypothetical protein
MMDADYYREQAERARRFARHLSSTHPEIQRQFLDMAQDYDEIVADLDTGAIEVRHAERMPQLRRQD